MFLLEFHFSRLLVSYMQERAEVPLHLIPQSWCKFSMDFAVWGCRAGPPLDKSISVLGVGMPPLLHLAAQKPMHSS